MKHPLTAWKTGIRSIPSIKINNNILSGFILNSEKIKNFLAKNID
jgi:hypothetical protein